MTSEGAERKTFRLSAQLSVEFTVGLGGMTCEWMPKFPRRLSVEEVEAYRAARDEMSQRLANLHGGPVLTVEAGTGKKVVHEPEE